MKKQKTLLVLAFSLGTLLGLASCGEETVSSPNVQTRSFTYTGSELSLGISNSEAYTVTGDKATEVGTYEAIISLNEGYTWTDKSTDSLTIEWSIVSAKVAKPSLTSASLTYTGSEQEVKVASSSQYTISANKATNAGSYKAKVSLTDKVNYSWADGTTNDLELAWTIAPAKIEKPKLEESSFTYNGEEQIISLSKANDLVTLTGNAGTNAGSYTAKASLKDKANYAWADGTTNDLELPWSISTQKVSIPELANNNFIYSGVEQQASLKNTSSLYSISNNKATNKGTYKAKVTLVDKVNYSWTDGSNDDLELGYSIGLLQIAKPTLANDSLTYNGSEQSVSFSKEGNYSIVDNKATNAGSYTAKAVLSDKENTCWEDGTTNDVSLAFSVEKAKVEAPEVGANLVYNGNKQQANIEESDLYEIEDNIETNAGSYTALLSLVDPSNYTWADGTVDDLELDFVIEKAKVNAPTDPEVLELTYNGSEQSIEFTSSDLYTVSGNKGTDAGQYVADVKLKDSNNYKWSTNYSGKVSWEIMKADYDTTGISFATVSKEYTGSEQEFIIEGLPTGVVATYTNNKLTNVGEVEAVAKFTVSENYNESVIKANVSITKSTAVITSNEVNETYDGEAVSGNASSTLGTVSYIYCSDKDDAENTSLEASSIVDVGTYYYKASVEGTTNFDGASGEWTVITIGKADFSADLSGITFEDDEITYDKTAHGLAITGELPQGVTVSYSSNNSQTYVGSYKIIATFEMGENYKTTTKEANLSIVKAVIEVGTYAELEAALHDDYSDNSDTDWLNTKIKLTANIDGENAVWVPACADSNAGKFNGEFDGNGKTISNLSITSIPYDAFAFSTGFFGCISCNAEIHDVTFDNINVDFTYTGAGGSGSNGINAGIVFGRTYPLAGSVSSTAVKTKLNNIEVKNSSINAHDTLGHTAHIGLIGGYDYSNNLRTGLKVTNSTLTLTGDTNKKIQLGTFFGDVNYEVGSFEASYKNCVASGNKIKVIKEQTNFTDCWVGGFFGSVNGNLKLEDCSSDTDIELITKNLSQATTSAYTGEETNFFGTSKSAFNPTVVNSTFTGTSTVKHLYTINSYQDLLDTLGSFNPTTQEEYEEYGRRIYRLTANIDCAGNAWTPVGADSEYGRFNAELDGQGYSISNYVINNSSVDLVNIGFFAAVGGKAYIHDVDFYPGTITLTYAKGSNSSTATKHIGSIVGMIVSSDVNVKNVTVYSPKLTINNNSAVTHTIYYGGAFGYDMVSNYIRDNIDVSNQTVTVNENSEIYGFGGLVGFVSGEASKNVIYKNCNVTAGSITVTSFAADDKGAVMGAYIGTLGNAMNLVFDNCTSGVSLISYDARVNQINNGASFPTILTGKSSTYAYTSISSIQGITTNNKSYRLPSVLKASSTDEGKNLLGWIGNQINTSSSTYVGTSYLTSANLLDGTSIVASTSTCSSIQKSVPLEEIDLYLTSAQVEAGYSLDTNSLFNGIYESEITWFKEANIYKVDVENGWNCANGESITSTGHKGTAQPYFAFTSASVTKYYDLGYLGGTIDTYCVMSSSLFYHPVDGGYSSTYNGNYTTGAFPSSARTSVGSSELPNVGSSMVLYGLITGNGAADHCWYKVIQLYIERAD